MTKNRMHYSLSKDGKDIISKGSYTELLLDLKDFQKNLLIPNQSGRNREYLEEYTGVNVLASKEYEEFAGGTWNDVLNLKNLKQFQDQLTEFRKHKLEERISKKVDFSVKRVRRNSDYDGDYNHDKRWEIQPFSNAIRTKIPVSCVDVNVDMSISSGMRADDINAYGAMVWAIVQLLETIGINCNINIVKSSHSITEEENLGQKVFLKIKKSGEYISPVALATCFQSVFYRRAIFSNIVLAADSQNKTVTSYLGTPKKINVDKNLWYENGTLNTRPGGLFDINQVEECIYKMIGNK